DGIQERVLRGRAALHPPGQAIAVDGPVARAHVDRLGRAALHGVDRHRVARHRPIAKVGGDRAARVAGRVHRGSYLAADFAISASISRRSAAARAWAAFSSRACLSSLPALRACALRLATPSLAAFHAASPRGGGCPWSFVGSLMDLLTGS